MKKIPRTEDERKLYKFEAAAIELRMRKHISANYPDMPATDSDFLDSGIIHAFQGIPLIAAAVAIGTAMTFRLPAIAILTGLAGLMHLTAAVGEIYSPVPHQIRHAVQPEPQLWKMPVVERDAVFAQAPDSIRESGLKNLVEHYVFSQEPFINENSEKKLSELYEAIRPTRKRALSPLGVLPGLIRTAKKHAGGYVP